MKKQSGFTLIELVTVIIILGILAAFAVPRFINLTSEAKAASIDGLAGSVKAAAALAHSMYVVAGTSPASVSMDGTPVALTNGYPMATDAGIKAALDSTDFSGSAASGTYTFWLTKYDDGAGAAPSDCKVDYTPQAGGAPAITVSDTCS